MPAFAAPGSLAQGPETSWLWSTGRFKSTSCRTGLTGSGRGASALATGFGGSGATGRTGWAMGALATGAACTAGWEEASRGLHRLGPREPPDGGSCRCHHGLGEWAWPGPGRRRGRRCGSDRFGSGYGLLYGSWGGRWRGCGHRLGSSDSADWPEAQATGACRAARIIVGRNGSADDAGTVVRSRKKRLH